MLRRVVLVLPLLALACPATSEPASASGRPQTDEVPVDASPPIPATPIPAEPAQVEFEPNPSAPVLDEALAAEPPEPVGEGELAPPDELAPVPPSGPEPGSPEADAELLALLDESTITQDEFAKAFGDGKTPKITEDGQFTFGAGERSRERSQVTIGVASISAGELDAADVEALARADLRELEVCHAMALSKDPAALGRVTLTLEFDAEGAVERVEVESKLSRALTDCLSSVAKAWSLAGASQAEVRLPLTLSTQ